MPYSGHVLTTDQLNTYAGPVVEQAVNQIVQLTPLEQVNERISDIVQLVRGHLQDFLAIYGIVLNDVKCLIRPRDERMRDLISLRAFGLSHPDPVRHYIASRMAENDVAALPTARVRALPEGADAPPGPGDAAASGRGAAAPRPGGGLFRGARAAAAQPGEGLGSGTVRRSARTRPVRLGPGLRVRGARRRDQRGRVPGPAQDPDAGRPPHPPAPGRPRPPPLHRVPG